MSVCIEIKNYFLLKQPSFLLKQYKNMYKIFGQKPKSFVNKSKNILEQISFKNIFNLSEHKTTKK